MKRNPTLPCMIGLIVLATQFISLTASSQNTLDKVGISTSIPVSAAYSLRIVSSDYTGYALQVRRSNDNATQDIGFTANGDLDTASLKSFAGSNTLYVTIWYDQSGNGLNLTQSDPTHQPAIVTNGIVNRQKERPFIHFQKVLGVYQSLDLPAAMSIVGHVSAVHQMAPGSYGFILGHSTQYYWHSKPGLLLVDVTLASTSIRNATGWTNGVATATGSIPWPSTLTVNQLEPSQTNVQTNWDNIGRDRVYHQVSDGGYAELIVFPNALATAHRSALASSQVGYFLNHSTLPVTWQSFTVFARAGNVSLEWQVTEQQVKEYIVQHSSTGNSWTDIASLQAVGEGSHTYTYTHTNAAAGKNFYRIRQTDIDGKFSYSDVRAIQISRSDAAFTLRNNLISDGNLQLQINKSTLVYLYDAAGRLVWKKQFTTGSHTVHTGDLRNGVYFLKSGTMVEKVVVR